jgi:hypothetical protein
MGSTVHEAIREMGPSRPAQPISGPIRAPFEIDDPRTIYSPPTKSHASTHSSFTAEEQRREGHHSGEERVKLVV